MAAALTLAAYVILGLLFAVYFVISGARRLDPAVERSGWIFRLMLIPGAIGLWPVLLVRLVKGHAETAS